MRRELQIFNADGSMNRDPLGEQEDLDNVGNVGKGSSDDMGRWVGKTNVRPDICIHGNHATSLKNLELQFTGTVAITPCPTCLAEMRKGTKEKKHQKPK